LACGFSEDNKFLASGAADGQVIIYEKKNDVLEKMPYFKWICGKWVTSLKFFKNFLFVGSEDGKIRIFDYKNKSLLKVVDTKSPIINIDVNQNYLCVASPAEFKVYNSKEILR
jgi:WD40 repeat protein